MRGPGAYGGPDPAVCPPVSLHTPSGGKKEGGEEEKRL